MKSWLYCISLSMVLWAASCSKPSKSNVEVVNDTFPDPNSVMSDSIKGTSLIGDSASDTVTVDTPAKVGWTLPKVPAQKKLSAKDSTKKRYVQELDVVSDPKGDSIKAAKWKKYHGKKQ